MQTRVRNGPGSRGANAAMLPVGAAGTATVITGDRHRATRLALRLTSARGCASANESGTTVHQYRLSSN
ncbi:MAG: hypothetical protein HC893_00820 [Chloroflexaceae bacterium]|nr:hypothetical protein [Chloroflexaceae bacterium]NJL32649.1 hypothetical protein [Chloroflexaceae bacterium]NJO06480.1 hypothetical protein [Chloroflexaceae bacterium]